ncbi:hypothetical protein OG225_42550 (plasmid) [Nocardia sp. NBC_01377]|uniref:hypothetical protein n=1 Tax=Nocardia sp. NBC_01377 TaxID=2903595 RepID=UPI0032519276
MTTTVNDLPTDKTILLARIVNSGTYSADTRLVADILRTAGIDAVLPGHSGQDSVTIAGEPLDVASVISRWGDHDSPYPQAGSEEIEQFRRGFASTALTIADNHGYGRIVETALRELGLTAYLPPTSKRVAIDLDIKRVIVDAPLTRTGDIQQDALIDTVLAVVRALLVDRSPLPTTDEPVTAPAS